MAWYSKIDTHLIQLGFKRSGNEATLYMKQDEDGLQLVISLYVDDMLVTRSNVKLLAEFKREMQDVFEMCDFGIRTTFLEWKYINATQVFLFHKGNMLLIYSRNSSLNHAKK
jgi:ketosteroid isomerase-like protein